MDDSNSRGMCGDENGNGNVNGDGNGDKERNMLALQKIRTNRLVKKSKCKGGKMGIFGHSIVEMTKNILCNI